MSNTYIMTNLELTILTAGWFTIGVIITSMVAMHLIDRAACRAYRRAWAEARDLYTSDAYR